MSCGDSAWNSGLKPLNSTVRSRAGEVCATGMVAPLGAARAGVADLLGERDVALADEVAVADRRRGSRSVTGVVVVDGEGHQRAGAVDDLDVLDRADLDAGDADVVALDDAGGVDELGLVLGRVAEARVADRAPPARRWRAW